MNLFFWNKNN